MNKFVDGMNKVLFDRYASCLLNKEVYIQLLVLRKKYFPLSPSVQIPHLSLNGNFPEKERIFVKLTFTVTTAVSFSCWI